ncbi:phosphonate C-P lyase system protein PhnK [Escherichia coli]|nr:phosphonate C-P lyase system protein PhnK [Escherichia coli]
MGIVGESGSGKTTLLKSISARLTPQQGEIRYENRSLYAMSEADRRRLLRTEWVWCISIRLTACAAGVGRRQYRRTVDGNRSASLRRYSRHRAEMAGRGGDSRQPDRRPADHLSGGMQQRLQIARNPVTHPKLVFMDEPTGGLDVSVQARLLDLLRGLVMELNPAVVIVTHDLGVARLLADRLLVMKQGKVVESGLTDRVLDDPHHPYTQLLVSSVLQN